MQKPHSLMLTLGLLSSVVLFTSFQPSLIKEWLGIGQPTTLPTASCQLETAPCRYGLPGGGSVTLNLLPRPLQAVVPMSVDIQLEGVEGISAGVDFAGVDMNMGFNLVPLGKHDSTHFAGQASLPICISGKMRWIATLQLETNKQLWHIPFEFVVGE